MNHDSPHVSAVHDWENHLGKMPAAVMDANGRALPPRRHGLEISRVQVTGEPSRIGTATSTSRSSVWPAGLGAWADSVSAKRVATW